MVRRSKNIYFFRYLRLIGALFFYPSILISDLFSSRDLILEDSLLLLISIDKSVWRSTLLNQIYFLFCRPIAHCRYYIFFFAVSSYHYIKTNRIRYENSLFARSSLPFSKEFFKLIRAKGDSIVPHR